MGDAPPAKGGRTKIKENIFSKNAGLHLTKPKKTTYNRTYMGRRKSTAEIVSAAKTKAKCSLPSCEQDDHALKINDILPNGDASEKAFFERGFRLVRLSRKWNAFFPNGVVLSQRWDAIFPNGERLSQWWYATFPRSERLSRRWDSFIPNGEKISHCLDASITNGERLSRQRDAIFPNGERPSQWWDSTIPNVETRYERIFCRRGIWRRRSMRGLIYRKFGTAVEMARRP